MDSRDLAYEPLVDVVAVYRVNCDGGCQWEYVSPDIGRAVQEAKEHREWHRYIIETLESQPGRCSYCEAKEQIKLAAAGRTGGLPYLYCGNCGGDW